MWRNRIAECTSSGRAPDEVALRGAVPAFGRGLLIGVGMFAAVIVNIAFVGGYEVRGLGSVTGAVALVGFMAAAVVVEELLFRGILFRIVEQRIGTWISLALTGVLFGAAHLLNANATVWSAVAIAIEAGFMLAAVYAATRNLCVPIGVHFGWNFAQGGIFSTSVSGQDAPQGLLDSVTSGPVLLSGGDFGPEASASSVLAGVVVTVAFLSLARKRGNIVPLRRRSAPADTLVR
ncbi:lysostaphin resistance A-like protein [Lentzea sp. E54]|uniref:CPBP family intramembrane glutamic endopeptidase n=1 Tax=Lentzea xerophila TaxID=3435883 RepID=UPI003DA4C455